MQKSLLSNLITSLHILLPSRTRSTLNRIRIDRFVYRYHISLQKRKKRQKTNPKKKLEENEPNSIPVAEQIPR